MKECVDGTLVVCGGKAVLREDMRDAGKQSGEEIRYSGNTRMPRTCEKKVDQHTITQPLRTSYSKSV